MYRGIDTFKCVRLIREIKILMHLLENELGTHVYIGYGKE